MAALVVLGLGLPRALVVCKRPCCGGHVKLTTACELTKSSPATGRDTAGCPCCGRHQAAGERDSDRRSGERNSVGCRGCENVPLGDDLGMPPAGADLHADACVLERVDVLAALRPQLEAAVCPHPPSTGPPRSDRRTELRATTVLRI